MSTNQAADEVLEPLGGSEAAGAAMLHAADAGLVRPGAGGRPVAHKIGWLETSCDDVAVVFTHRGPVVVTVYAQGSIDSTVSAFGRAAARAALR